MTDVSNKTLVALVGVALVITVIGTISSLIDLDLAPWDEPALTGAATSDSDEKIIIEGETFEPFVEPNGIEVNKTRE